MSGEHVAELDAESKAAVEGWLTHVLPKFAEECAEKIRADAYAEVSKSIGEGVLPYEAVGELTPVRWASFKFDSRYLTKYDSTYLRRLGQQIAAPISYFQNMIWSAAAIVLFVSPSIWFRSVSSYPVSGILASIFLLILLFLLTYIWSSMIRRRIVSKLGPLGVAFFHTETTMSLFPCIPPFFIGLMHLYTLRLSIPGLSIGDIRWNLVVVITLVLLFLLISVRGYFNVRARIRNNYAIVTELLGLPEYWIEEDEGA